MKPSRQIHRQTTWRVEGGAGNRERKECYGDLVHHNEADARAALIFGGNMSHRKGVVIPEPKDGSGPNLLLNFFVKDLGRACVSGIKFILEEAGEVVEFGTAAIVQNDGTTKRTKKRQ